MKKSLSFFIGMAVVVAGAALPIHAETAMSFGIESDTRGPEELTSFIDEIRQEALPFLNSSLSVEDIDLTRAEKIYDIDNAEDFPLSCRSKKEAIDYLENCDYFWMLPITAGGKTIEVGINMLKTMPDTTDMSEDTIQYLHDILGKWHIFVISVPTSGNHIISHKEIAENMASRQRGLAGQDWDAVMVYGMYDTMGYATLLMSEDSVEYLMPLSPPMGLEVPAEVLAETSFMDYDGMLLPFSDLQEMIDNRPKPEAGGLFSAGGGGDWGLSAEAGCRDKEDLLGF